MPDTASLQNVETFGSDIADEVAQQTQDPSNHITVRTSIQVNSTPEGLQPKPDTPTGSIISQTSTVEYNQEGYGKYSVRVKELCCQLWPTLPKRSRAKRFLSKWIKTTIRKRGNARASESNEFYIERLKGGGFNRVIGITINRNSSNREELILRVPRFHDARPDREVANVQFVSQHPSIPVAKIKAFDFSEDNPLNSPYVIQSRIPGHDLQSKLHSFPTLTHKQQCVFAKDFGRILRSMQKIQNRTPGRIDASTEADGTRSFSIRPFEVTSKTWEGDIEKEELDEGSHAKSAPEYDSTLEFFMAQFDRWSNARQGQTGMIMTYIHCLTSVALQMDQKGYLGDDTYCLCHLDLNNATRNIMVDSQSDGSIAAILD